MLVSIIIPSFRQPQFLGRAIESCLDQDHRDLEVIVVEDHSRDASLGLALSLSKRDPRVKVVSCPENGGLGRARNIGIGHAVGDLLCFLDSDDYLLDRSLSARLEAFPDARSAHGDSVVGVYGDWQHVAESIDQPVVRQARATMPLVSAATYTGENVFICSAPLVERTAVVDAGGFPEGLPMLEDFALWAKMIAAGNVFVPVPHVVSTYRQRPNSMLRGDGLVLMSDHVQIINDWITKEGVRLADGGAMAAWLEDSDPRPYGRMSWSVPSILGNFGGGTAASALNAGAGSDDASLESSPLDDFMVAPPSRALEDPPPSWSIDNRRVDHWIAVATLAQSLAATSLVAEAAQRNVSLGVASEDPTKWVELWPLALAGIDVDAKGSVAGVDFAELGLTTVQIDELIRHGIELLWPDPMVRSGSCVFVPYMFAGHPGLDAWVSTALQTLAECGEEPFIMADPRVRDHLRGFRSEVTSIGRLLSVSAVVAPRCDELDFIAASAPTVIFDPSNLSGEHARTMTELELSLKSVDRSIRQQTEAPAFVAELVHRLSD